MKILRIITVPLLLLLLLPIWSCRRTPQHVLDVMQSAERMMEEHPDSALTLLETIDTTELYGSADKARRALLMSMALDKNYIDTTDFRVLQPAIDYYEKHGDADQRLKTRYYQGIIYLNRGEDGKALESFLKAEEDTAGCKDIRMLGILRVAQGSMYWREYNYTEFIRSNQKAASIFRSIKDTARYVQCQARLISGAAQIGDKKLMEESSRQCLDKILRYGKNKQYLSIIIPFYPQLRPKEEFQAFVNQIEDKELLASLSGYIGYSYYQYGDISTALDYLDRADDTDPIFNSQARIEILLTKADYQGALKAYDTYLEQVEKEINERKDNNLLFARRQYALEIESMRGMIKREKIIYLLSFVVLISLMGVLVTGILYKNVRLKRRLAEKEIEELKLTLENETEEISRILEENKDLSSRIRHLLTTHVEIANGIIGEILRDNKTSDKTLRELRRRITDKKESFLRELLQNYRVSHPQMIGYLEEQGLTEQEQEMICLYALQLRGKEVGHYLGKTSHYNDVVQLRQKLSISKSDLTLRDYVRSILLHLDD